MGSVVVLVRLVPRLFFFVSQDNLADSHHSKVPLSVLQGAVSPLHLEREALVLTDVHYSSALGKVLVQASRPLYPTPMM